MNSKSSRTVGIVSLAVWLLPANASADWHHREAAIMGTAITVELWTDEDALAGEAIAAVLGDLELERKLVARVRMFHFEQRDVEIVTTTKPIDFFPA